MNTHKCFAPDCSSVLHKNKVVCKAHNSLVSEFKQKEVNDTWRLYRIAKTDEERFLAAREYDLACYRAMNEIKDAQKRKRAA